MSGGDLAGLAARAGLRLPRVLTVAITSRCNLACRHCWVEAGSPARGRHAPLDGLLRLVDDFAALGGEELWFTGGEPLCHPHWPALLSHACAHRSLRCVGIQTNGTPLDEGNVARLRALPAGKLFLQISLDGASPRTHDPVRGRGSFAEVTAALARLAAAGLAGRTTLAFTEMRHDMEDVPELLELVARLGLRRVVGGTLVKGARAARSGLELPSPEQYLALLSRYHRDRRFRELYEQHGTFCAVEWWKGRHAVRGDPCPFVEHPYVTAEGTIHPCKLFHAEGFAVAGAFERPLRDALADGIPRWSELAARARRRSAALPECQPCPARLDCAGGCMGRAEATSGDPDAVEDRCALRRAVHAWCPDEECGSAGLRDGEAASKVLPWTSTSS